MNTTELKSRLHEIIDGIEDNEVLEAIHTILSSRPTSHKSHSTSGKPLTKESMDEMLIASESDIKSGRLTNQKQLKEEIKSWRKK